MLTEEQIAAFHDIGWISSASLFNFDNPDYRHARPPQFHEADAVTILAKLGDTLFFGPYTAHASFENTSDTYRRILINGYAYPGANQRVYPGDGAGRSLSVDSV